jgi:hypothetical protein
MAAPFVQPLDGEPHVVGMERSDGTNGHPLAGRQVLDGPLIEHVSVLVMS